MRLLFCKNDSWESKAIMRWSKEDCSHVALEFDSTVISSGIAGWKRRCQSDFLTRNKIVHVIELGLTREQHAQLHSIYYHSPRQKIPGLFMILMDFLFKTYRPEYLCTSIFKNLPNWLICNQARQESLDLITAHQLYNLILERIRTDTVKILKKF